MDFRNCSWHFNYNWNYFWCCRSVGKKLRKGKLKMNCYQVRGYIDMTIYADNVDEVLQGLDTEFYSSIIEKLDITLKEEEVGLKKFDNINSLLKDETIKRFF